MSWWKILSTLFNVIVPYTHSALSFSSTSGAFFCSFCQKPDSECIGTGCDRRRTWSQHQGYPCAGLGRFRSTSLCHTLTQHCHFQAHRAYFFALSTRKQSQSALELGAIFTKLGLSIEDTLVEDSAHFIPHYCAIQTLTKLSFVPLSRVFSSFALGKSLTECWNSVR